MLIQHVNMSMRSNGLGRDGRTAVKDAMDDDSVVKDLVCHGEE